MHQNFPVNEFLEVLGGETYKRTPYKWIAIVAVNNPHYGTQIKLYMWQWKNNRWSTQTKLILKDHQSNDVNLQDLNDKCNELWEKWK